MSAANMHSTVLSAQPGREVRAMSTHDGGHSVAHENVLGDIDTERSSSNPSPHLSDNSPTPHGVTAQFNDGNISLIEPAVACKAVDAYAPSTKEAVFHSSVEFDTNPVSAHDDARPLADPLSLSAVIDRMHLIGFPVPPTIEAMLRDPDAFDRNGVRIVDSPPSGYIADEAKLQSIVERAKCLRDTLDGLVNILDATALAEPECTSELPVKPVLTAAEAMVRFRRGGLAELLQTREGWGFVLLVMALECLQVGYELWQQRRAIEKAA